MFLSFERFSQKEDHWDFLLELLSVFPEEVFITFMIINNNNFYTVLYVTFSFINVKLNGINFISSQINCRQLKLGENRRNEVYAELKETAPDFIQFLVSCDQFELRGSECCSNTHKTRSSDHVELLLRAQNSSKNNLLN